MRAFDPACRPREADASEIPEALLAPPWLTPGRKRHPEVFDLPVFDRAPTLHWLPGEQQQFALTPMEGYSTRPREEARTLREVLDDYRPGTGYDKEAQYLSGILAIMPENGDPELLVASTIRRLWRSRASFRRVLARVGAGSLHVVLMQRDRPRMADVMLPIDATCVTRQMMRFLDGYRARKTASVWLCRHAETAALDLIPLALSRTPTLARQALLEIAENGHVQSIHAAAARFDDRISEAVTSIVQADPLLRLPKRIPRIPKWLTLEALPPVLLRNRSAMLPRPALVNFCVMLGMCRLHWNYPGVRKVADELDADSLAGFAWALYEAWKSASYPNGDIWAVCVQGILGNDDTAKYLSREILRRPWNGGEALCAAFDSLAAIGTAAATSELRIIAATDRGVNLRKKAKRELQRRGDM
jgi:hypothetical protein